MVGLSLAKLALASMLATSIAALPVSVVQTRDDGGEDTTDATNNFSIHVINKCAHAQPAGIFRINPDYSTTTLTPLTTIAAKTGTHTFTAPFNGVGLRLAVKQDQFAAQDLFEFGHSSYAGKQGTAYDLSLFGGTAMGMKVVPSNGACETKICTSKSCPHNQAWTNPDQKNEGSPADTVCYQGKINFTVTYCP